MSKPFYTAPDGITLYHGDCRTVLSNLPAESVDCVVTSPPYLGLRKYAGVEPGVWGGDVECRHEWGESLGSTTFSPQRDNSGGYTGNGRILGTRGEQPRSGGITGTATQGSYCRLCGAWLGCYGLEPSIALYVAHTVEVCAAIWRVLKPSGSFWLNLGDSFAGSGKGPSNSLQRPCSCLNDRQLEAGAAPTEWIPVSPGLKPKDLQLIPQRVAIALQEWGWWVREDVIWAKTSCMPESVTDRCTRSHEYIWHLTKRANYYHDAEAIREDWADERRGDPGNYRADYLLGAGRNDAGTKNAAWLKGMERSGRNARSVWTIGPEPLREAHYASFPSEIPRRCILASTSERGCCPTCGQPWVRVTEKDQSPTVAPSELDRYGTGEAGVHRKVGGVYQKWLDSHPTQTIGWSPSCSCYGEPPRDAAYFESWKESRPVVPAVVLDPFVGSGTTLIVARQLGRRGIGIDASETYLRDIAIPRIEGQTPNLFALEVAP